MHEWKRSSDIHSYLTDSSNPILLLYYEHLASILINDIKPQRILDYFKNHKSLFPKLIPKSEEPKEQYFQQMESFIFSDCYKSHLKIMNQFKKNNNLIIADGIDAIGKIAKEKENHLLEKIDSLNSLSEQFEFVKNELLNIEKSEEDRLLNNIERFRSIYKV